MIPRTVGFFGSSSMLALCVAFACVLVSTSPPHLPLIEDYSDEDSSMSSEHELPNPLSTLYEDPSQSDGNEDYISTTDFLEKYRNITFSRDFFSKDLVPSSSASGEFTTNATLEESRSDANKNMVHEDHARNYSLVLYAVIGGILSVVLLVSCLLYVMAFQRCMIPLYGDQEAPENTEIKAIERGAKGNEAAPETDKEEPGSSGECGSKYTDEDIIEHLDDSTGEAGSSGEQTPQINLSTPLPLHSQEKGKPRTENEETVLETGV